MYCIINLYNIVIIYIIFLALSFHLIKKKIDNYQIMYSLHSLSFRLLDNKLSCSDDFLILVQLILCA